MLASSLIRASPRDLWLWLGIGPSQMCFIPQNPGKGGCPSSHILDLVPAVFAAEDSSILLFKLESVLCSPMKNYDFSSGGYYKPSNCPPFSFLKLVKRARPPLTIHDIYIPLVRVTERHPRWFLYHQLAPVMPLNGK